MFASHEKRRERKKNWRRKRKKVKIDDVWKFLKNEDFYRHFTLNIMLSISLLLLLLFLQAQIYQFSLLSYFLLVSFMNITTAVKRALHTHTNIFLSLSLLCMFFLGIHFASRVKPNECTCLFLLRYFSIHLVTYFGSNYTDFRLTRSFWKIKKIKIFKKKKRLFCVQKNYRENFFRSLIDKKK